MELVHDCGFPENTGYWPNVGSVLVYVWAILRCGSRQRDTTSSE